MKLNTKIFKYILIYEFFLIYNNKKNIKNAN